MRLYRIMKATPGNVRTARSVRVQWDDGTQETVGVPDAVENADVADFICGGGRRQVMGWTEIEPRDTRPQRPPD